MLLAVLVVKLVDYFSNLTSKLELGKNKWILTELINR